MHNEQYSFPQYRKYKGLNTWYKITSESVFDEVVKMGDKYIQHKVHATIYPEKLRIQDMLACRDGLWESIDSQEYEDQLNKVS